MKQNFTVRKAALDGVASQFALEKQGLGERPGIQNTFICPRLSVRSFEEDQ